MTLVIEDGTKVANANSYATLTEIRNYATLRGITLSAVDATLEVLAVKAMDYLEAIRTKYKGDKKYSDQSLQWPRTDVWIDGFEFSNSSIPQLLKNAQCQLCIELHNGAELLMTTSGFGIKKEKVDVIETEYDLKVGSTSYIMRSVSALIDPLLKANGFSIYSLRV